MTNDDGGFEWLAASRRQWIADILLKAELEWTDIAGRAAPEHTLWTWAWERFAGMVHDGLPGIDETRRIRVHLAAGETVVGFPEGRRSQRGELFLLAEPDDSGEPVSVRDLVEAGPFSIDDIVRVEAC